MYQGSTGHKGSKGDSFKFRCFADTVCLVLVSPLADAAEGFCGLLSFFFVRSAFSFTGLTGSKRGSYPGLTFTMELHGAFFLVNLRSRC